MSNGARIAIAIVGLFFAAMCSVLALASGKPLAWLPTIFCLLMSIACIRGIIGTIALRAVAATISLLCLGCVVLDALQGEIGTGRRSEASLPNAISAF